MKKEDQALLQMCPECCHVLGHAEDCELAKRKRERKQ